MSLFKYLCTFLIAVTYNVHCLAMEQEVELKPNEITLKLSKTHEQTIEIADHFFKNTIYFKLNSPFSNSKRIDWSAQYNLSDKSESLFIQSLTLSFNSKLYFDHFMMSESAVDLYEMYEIYDYINYAEIENILCAVILVKLHNAGLIQLKKEATFTAKDFNNRQKKLKALNENQKQYHNQLLDEVGKCIFKDGYDTESKHDLFINFKKYASNILNYCNIFKYNEIKIQDNNFNEELKNEMCEALINYNHILYLTDLNLNDVDGSYVLNIFDEKINKLILKNVAFPFVSDYDMSSLLRQLRDPNKNKVESLDIYLTGNILFTDEKGFFVDEDKGVYNLLCSVYSKKSNELGRIINYESPMSSTLFVDKNTVDSDLQQKLNRTSAFSLYQAIVKKKNFLNNIVLPFIRNIPVGAVLDIPVSLIYNMDMQSTYNVTHFIVPICLLVFIFKNQDNRASLSTASQYTFSNTEEAKQARMQRAEKIKQAQKWSLVYIGLLFSFYVLQEIYNRPNGWHTYSFFPWIILLINPMINYLSEKTIDYDEDISNQQVYFIDNIDQFFQKNEIVEKI